MKTNQLSFAGMAKIAESPPYPYYPDFLTKVEADAYFLRIRAEVPWSRADEYFVGGACQPAPREAAWYGSHFIKRIKDAQCFRVQPSAWTPAVLELKVRVESFLKESFNSCGINLYRDHTRSIGAHRDSNAESDWTHSIASVSLGAERAFHVFKCACFKSCACALTHSQMLDHGSLAVMPAGFQETYRHAVPKSPRKCGERINLTFRFVVPLAVQHFAKQHKF